MKYKIITKEVIYDDDGNVDAQNTVYEDYTVAPSLKKAINNIRYKHRLRNCSWGNVWIQYEFYYEEVL